MPEFQLWTSHIPMDGIRIKGQIVKGFQRGSRQLGCPTANIEMTPENKEITTNLIPGIYFATGQFTNSMQEFIKSSHIYSCVLSIGWNPVYENREKTVEVYIMDDFKDRDFYGEDLEIILKAFIRAEALFTSFDNLILAI